MAAHVIPHYVPYVNRPDMLREALASVPVPDRGRVVVVDNRDNFSREPHPVEVAPYAVRVKAPETALNHSQLLTWLVFETKKDRQPYFTWMHNDCMLMGSTLEQLVERAEEATAEGRRWAVILTEDHRARGIWNHVDVCAAINVDALLAVGCWDWVRFPDYYSDYDCYGRLRKAGYEITQSGLTIEHMSGGTSTIKADGNRALVNELTWQARTELWVRRAEELGLEWPPVGASA